MRNSLIWGTLTWSIFCALMLAGCGGTSNSRAPAPSRDIPLPSPPLPDTNPDFNFTQQAIADWASANRGLQDTADLCSDAVPTLEGTEGEDTLTGTAGDDIIFGYAGNDIINGGGGHDIICAGDGADIVSGGGGNDYIDGGNGADVLRGNYGDDVVVGNEGNDSLYGNSGDDILTSGPGTNKLYGGPDDDLLFGDSEKDTAFGQIGSDMLAGTLNTADCLDASAECEADPYARFEPLSAQSDPNASFYPAARPKVILYLMMDDADYNDFGYQSNTAITPNFDTVAAGGMKFTDFYAASGICSPSRISLLTGNSPTTYGLTRLWPDVPKALIETPAPDYYWSMRGLDRSERTIGKVMKSVGYQTFHIGKWHSGTARAEFLPSGHGFDDFKIMKALPDRNVLEYLGPEGYANTPSQTWRPQYQADQIIEFIENSTEDVFVNWWPIEPHTPLIVPPTFTDEVNRNCCNFDLSTQRGVLLSMMYAFDAEFGRVVDYLKSEGLFEDSLIIVTSDNGGLQTALDTGRVLGGNKGNLREGGIRVPLFASWPGEIAENTSNDSVTTTYDVMPTLAAIAGAEAGDVLGEDFRSALFTTSGEYSRETPAFFQLNIDSWRTNETEEFSDQRAIRDGCYKLTNVGDPRGALKLYNLCNDMTESNDLSSTESARFNTMTQAYQTLSLAAGDVIYRETLKNEQVELQDWRLNVHNDNLSIRAVATEFGTAPVQTIYRRGDLHIYIDGSAGRVVLDAIGVSNQDVPAAYKSIRLSGAVNQGDEIVLVARGYIRSATSISLSVNGIEVGSVSAAASSAPGALGNSIYALKNEPEARAFLGDENMLLEGVSVNLAAGQY